jgi:peptide/nickel transport system substrate-binding protein
VLPPNFPGYRPYCPYTVDPSGGDWLGPDLTRAKQLIAASHTKGMRITVWWARPLNSAYAPYIVSLLDRLGYRANLRWFTGISEYFSAVGDSRRRAQIGIAGWIADYPAASDFIDLNFSCHAFAPSTPNSDPTEFCDKTIDRRIKHALALDSSDPGAANLLWSRIDHQIVDNAPIVPLANGSWDFVVSKRVGNFQVQAAANAYPLLEQFWVR